MTTSDRLAAAVAVQAVLLSVVRARRRSAIAAYVPVGSEPGGANLPSVLAAGLPPDGRLLLPVLLNDGDLDWAVYSGALEPARRGLLEPPGPRLGVDAVRDASVVILPAVAADACGHRLGRGGGSYDRALTRLAQPPAADVLTVALLYDGELLDHVPAEPHDRSVRAVITPTGGLTLSRGVEWTN